MTIKERYVKGLEAEKAQLEKDLKIMKSLFESQCGIIAEQVKEKRELKAEIKKLNEILNYIDVEYAKNEKMPCGAVTHDKGKTKSIYYILAEIGGDGND